MRAAKILTDAAMMKIRTGKYISKFIISWKCVAKKTVAYQIVSNST